MNPEGPSTSENGNNKVVILSWHSIVIPKLFSCEWVEIFIIVKEYVSEILSREWIKAHGKQKPYSSKASKELNEKCILISS